MAQEQEELQNEQEEKKDKKEKKSIVKPIILAGIVLLLGAGGFWGSNLFLKREKIEAGTAPEVKKEKAVSIVYPLKSFIVNLRDKTGVGKRYLKVTMEIEVGNEKAKAAVDSQAAQLRDTILLLLSSQSIKEINSMEGKMELKHGLLTRMNRILGESIIRKIYFTEFVVQ